MTHILLVEDDSSLGETLQERLIKEGYQTLWATSIQEGFQKFSENHFDLVILDVGLPDGSGFELANKIRALKSTPFIFMTAMNTAENRLYGYELGAEEFIPKPFHLKELFIRVKHVMEKHASTPQDIVVGCVQLNLQKMSVTDEKKQETFLATKDFQVLKLLIEQSPKAVHRDEILNIVWGEDKFPSHRTVDNVIVRLRQTLKDESGNVIRSVRGIGYQWINERQ